MELPIAAIVVRERTRRDLRNIESLAESIRETGGPLHPPVVRLDATTGEYVLVAGARRLAAMRHLGYDHATVTIARSLTDELSALKAEGEENTEREPFTPSEAVAHAERIEAVIAAQARERMAEAGRKAAPGRPAERCAESAQVSPKPERTRDAVAKAVGMSHPKLAGARQVIAATTDETLPEPVREAAAEAVAEMDRTGNVHGAVRLVEAAKVRHAMAEAINAEEQALKQAIADKGLVPITDPKKIAEQRAYIEMRAAAYGAVRDVLAVADAYSADQLAALTTDRMWADAQERARRAVAFLVRTYALMEAAA